MGILVATRKVERQRRYYSQLQYSLIALLAPMMLFLGGGTLVTKAYSNSLQFQAQQTSPLTQRETYVVGKTFKMGNLQYKINSVRTSDGDVNFVTSPRVGNTFLLVNVTIEKQGSTDVVVRSMIGMEKPSAFAEGLNKQIFTGC